MTDPKDSQTIPGVVHDIKQMLTVISGRAGLLIERIADQELRHHCQAMEMAATDAAAMLGRLPGVGSRIPTGPARLLDVATTSCRLILPPDGRPWLPEDSGPSGRWTAAFDIPGDLWAEIPAQVLREVLNNLLTNALAVMPDGGGIVIRGSASDQRVRLVIQDSGPGVPSGKGEGIFELGFTTSGQPGRGHGLATCRLLLEERGGKLFLDQDSGPGATFVIDLPLADRVRGQDIPIHSEAASGMEDGAPPLEPGSILVVDDEPAVRDMLSDVLGELGWRATVAENADQAIGFFHPGLFSLAILDQSLPGKSGLELAKELRSKDSRIVLVLVSGWGNEDILARATAEGIDFSAEKPLTVGKIRVMLGQAVARFQERGKEREEF